jgi:hypothetical protein
LMKRKDAQRVSALMFKHHDELTGLLRELEPKLSDDEFAGLSDAVSRILTVSLTNIVNPIISKHPSLAPDGFLFPWLAERVVSKSKNRRPR